MNAYRFVESSGNSIINTLAKEEMEAFEDSDNDFFVDNSSKKRYGKLNCLGGRFYFVSSDPNLVASKRKFLSQIQIFVDALPEISKMASATEERLQVISKRLIHNLTSLNGHMLQDIFSVVSQDRLAGNIRRSVPLIVEEMKGRRAPDFAKCFLGLAKHATAMKNEFSVFKKIERIDVEAEFKSHLLHKVVMNVAYLFFSDFADNQSYVNVSHSNLRASFDYEFAFVALYHLFDNSAKYIRPKTHLDVRIYESQGDAVVEFSMSSLEIGIEEFHLIRNEGYSGALPKKLNLNGDGIGLRLVERVMAMHQGSLAVEADNERGFEYEGVRYCANRFLLKFPLHRD